MTKKIVINRCFGGFSVTEAVYNHLGIKWDGYGYIGYEDYKRDDARLIEAIESIGLEASSGKHAKLKIVEIPSDVEWHIEEYDGFEHVAENHRTWE